MGRWRNVRDNFMRFQRKITKSGQAAETGRRYIYARQLDFLMGTRENIPTEASSQAEEEDAEADNEEPPAGNTDEIPGPSRTAQRRAAPTAPPRKRKIEDALLTFMQQRPAPTPAPDDDEDRAFFNSLLPMVRGFTPDQKIEFRLELLKMVKRYRSGLLPIQSQHEMQHFHFVTQPTPIRSHTQLQILIIFPPLFSHPKDRRKLKHSLRYLKGLLCLHSPQTLLLHLPNLNIHLLHTITICIHSSNY